MEVVTVACRDKTRTRVVVVPFYFYQMPGPSNSNVKRKRKSRGKDNKSQNILLVPAQPQLSQESTAQGPPPTDYNYKSNLPSLPPPPYLETPPPLLYQLQNSKETLSSLDDHVPGTVEEVMLKQPFIYDPGNGPRVRIAKEFISSFFAQPPAYDVSSMLVLLFFECKCDRPNVRIHYALNLHRKKSCRCFVQYCQKKLR